MFQNVKMVYTPKTMEELTDKLETYGAAMSKNDAPAYWTALLMLQNYVAANTTTKHLIRELRLEWLNDYLSVSKYANDLGIDDNIANNFIKALREVDSAMMGENDENISDD